MIRPPGQDNTANPQCSTGAVGNIVSVKTKYCERTCSPLMLLQLEGSTSDHVGPYDDGIVMGC